MKTTTVSVINVRKRKGTLTRQEIIALRKANVGYGNFIANARVAGVHENTFRYILDRGYGLPENIEKIRKKLLR